MHISIRKKFYMKNKAFHLQIIISLSLIFLLISSFGFTSSLKIVTINSNNMSEHLIFGTANYSDGGRATSARVDVISSFGKLTTWVNSNEYWEVDCGDPGPNWPIGMKFTVYITGCCSHGGWSGSDSDVVSGTSNNMGNIIIYPNVPPNTPSTPLGPIARQIGSIGIYATNATDINALNEIQYRFDWDAGGSHNYSQYTQYVNSGEYANKSHHWDTPGTYIVKAQTRDEHGAISDWSEGFTVLVYESNNPPEIPIIEGPSQGKEVKTYFYNISTTDLDSDPVRYLLDWGDGNDTGWIGPYQSEEQVMLSHSWAKRGTYGIRLKAKDIYGEESEWSEPFSIQIVAPVISIESINGNLFYVNAVITNVGDGIATDVNWNILLNGGYFFSGKNTSDTIKFIEPGGQITVTSDIIFGLSGRTIITVTANIEGQNTVNKEVESSIFLFFIKVKT